MLRDSAGVPASFHDILFPDHRYRASEIPAAEEVSMEPRPTPEAVAIVPEIPASERIGEPPPLLAGADARVEALLAELLTLLKERKAIEAVAAARWTRCSELLEHVRTVRRVLPVLLGHTRSPSALMDRLERAKYEPGADEEFNRLAEALTELQDWLAKPL